MKILTPLKLLTIVALLLGISGCTYRTHSSLPLGPQLSQEEKNNKIKQISATDFVILYTCSDKECATHTEEVRKQTKSLIDNFDIEITNESRIQTHSGSPYNFKLLFTIPDPSKQLAESFECKNNNCDWSMANMGETTLLIISNLTAVAPGIHNDSHEHILYVTFNPSSNNKTNIFFELRHKYKGDIGTLNHRKSHGGGTGI